MNTAASGGRLKRLFSAQDMSLGAPWKRILEFSLPMLIGNLAQQMYNTADSVIVGIYVGDNALAAVGSASPILNLLLALFVGIATGAGILVSQYFGAKERDHLANVIGNCMTLTLLASVIIMVVGPLVTRPLLTMLNTPASILNWCTDYLNIFFLGIVGFAAYNILSGVLRGLGDSLSALVFLIVATVLNIGLDLWFVAGLHMGVAGVAFATVIAQAISAVLCCLKLFRMHDVFTLRAAHLRPVRQYVGKIIRLGVPSGVTQAIFSMAMLVVQSLTNSFGEAVIACNVIVMRVDGFAMMPNFTFGQAMTTFTGQNVGAGKPERVRAGAKQGTLMALVCAIALTLCILLFGRSLMSIFTSTASLVELSYHMMSILAVGYIAMAVTQSLSGVMRGAGDTSPDGPMNIYCAVKTAASQEAVGMGVLVCLNETLHAPGEVMKTHSANPATFQSPWWGPIGYVDLDKIIIRRKPLNVLRFAPKSLTARVDLIKCMTGSTRDYIDFAVSQGCKGIVIEGFGRGNVPPPMVPGIEDAVKAGVAVVLTTRTPGGRVLDVYGYPGSVTDTRRAGLAMGGEISAAKARLKLMIVLSEHPELATDRDALEKIFDI